MSQSAQDKARIADFRVKFDELMPREAMMANNDLNYSKGPIIGWCPEWKTVKHPITKEVVLDPITQQPKLCYRTLVYESFKEMVELAGGSLYTLDFGEDPADYRHKLHGLIIPGGSDIDPKVYNERNSHSYPNNEVFDVRWKHDTTWFAESDPKMPVLAICYGYEMVCCVHGAKIVQHLHNAHEHDFGYREMKIVEGTHLHAALGKDSIRVGCYHHQNISAVPEDLVCNSYDAEDWSPHGVEYPMDSGRVVMTVLFHPELMNRMVGEGNRDEDQQKIMSYFVKKSDEYREDVLGL